MEALGRSCMASWGSWRLLDGWEALGGFRTSLGGPGRHLEGSWRHSRGSWAALGWIMEAKTKDFEAMFFVFCFVGLLACFVSLFVS